MFSREAVHRSVAQLPAAIASAEAPSISRPT
jgi:hypothetical protein